jgi:hypothetical protein
MADLTASRLREVLNYDPDTGVFTRLVASGSRGIAGNPAGWRNTHGHTRISVDGRDYYAHRLAWLWMTREWPPEQIDHINGDPTDNRWKNLRPATPSQNLGNSRHRRNNTSGFKGVYWHRPTGEWRARIMINRRNIHLGLFDTPEAAHAAYLTAAQKHFGEFARAA